MEHATPVIMSETQIEREVEKEAAEMVERWWKRKQSHYRLGLQQFSVGDSDNAVEVRV
jgi:hypothetical protein